ncbi:MAG: transposase, partial [Synergistaceae bacterium]|nr:transposase [Synergistaceae bacterium]
HKKNDLKLSDRVYKCEQCGTVINRDFNASLNLFHYGLEKLASNQ